MFTLRKSMLVALAAAMPLHMTDSTDSASPTDDDAKNVDASPAADTPASDTTSSATPASTDSATASSEPATDTAAETERAAAPATESPTLAEVPASDTAATTAAVTPGEPGDTASLGTDANGTPITPPTAITGDAVSVPAEHHAEAKDRFAGILAKLHQFEDEAIDELKEDLLAIGELLHLHSKASATAQATGDYQAGDAS